MNTVALLVVWIAFFGFLMFQSTLDLLNVWPYRKNQGKRYAFSKAQTLRLLQLIVIFILWFVSESMLMYPTIIMLLTLVYIGYVLTEYVYRTKKKISAVFIKTAWRYTLLILWYALLGVIFMVERSIFFYGLIVLLTFLSIALFYVLLFKVILHRSLIKISYEMPFSQRLYTLAPELKHHLYMVEGKKQRLPINAALLGHQKALLVMLSKRLLSVLSSQQIEGIIVHELAHRKLNHLRWRIMFLMVTVCLFFSGIYGIYETGLLPFLGIETTLVGYASVTFVIMGFFSFVAETIFMILMRHQEYAADSYTAKKGFAQALAQALFLIEQHEQPDMMHPVASFFYTTHPDTAKRLKKLRDLSDTPDHLGLVFSLVLKTSAKHSKN